MGGYGFFGDKSSVGNFDGKKILSTTWAEKKHILKALYALKNIAFVVIFLKKIPLRHKSNFFIFRLRKKPQPPFKLNGCSLSFKHWIFLAYRNEKKKTIKYVFALSVSIRVLCLTIYCSK